MRFEDYVRVPQAVTRHGRAAGHGPTAVECCRVRPWEAEVVAGQHNRIRDHSNGTRVTARTCPTGTEGIACAHRTTRPSVTRSASPSTSGERKTAARDCLIVRGPPAVHSADGASQ
jgi:hypothetical protein